MTRWVFTLGLLSGIAAPASAVEPAKTPGGPTPAGTPEQVEFFEKKVRPVLAEQCYSCHGAKKQSAGLRLDTADGMKKGADNGPVVVPGDPARSRLVASVKRAGDFPMPPKAALPADTVAALTEWVKMGAPFPEAAGTQAVADPRKHWAFQPIKDPPLPQLRDPRGEVRNEIDRFVLAKLEEKGLAAAPRADKRTLIRRAHFDLLGLPPTADEVDAFEKDDSPQAFEKLVDKLLASPHYGERWGRYWLDVARYADTKGYVFQEDRNFPYAYTYRDYVIRSFNEDKPFDRFVVDQLAADKLPLGDDKRPLAAMGFLTLGRRFLNNTPDIIDDRIDVVSRGLMGLTVACARCHDHKFDPVPIKDYYSLYGVFASSVEPKEPPLIGGAPRTPEVEAFEKELAKREVNYTAEVAKRHGLAVAKLRSADSVAEYVRAVLDARGKPGDQIQGFVRDRDLTGFVFARWRAYLTEQLKQHSPVFSPLAQLRDIPETDFAAKAPAVIAGLGADPAVLKALADAKPKTFREAAAAVGKVIAGATKDQPALLAVLGPGGPTDIPVADAEKIFNRLDRDQLAAVRQKIDAFKASSPAAPPRAHVLNDTPSPVEPVVFLRGNPGNRGPAVPRQMPEVVAGAARKPFTDGSGRLELARSIVSPDNPLTARVFVNRVWIGHFGQGLVRTPSDFGVRSDPPTHPELLDWLAKRFMQDGWSVKQLHRRIMLSATYQQASSAERGARNAEQKATNSGSSVPHSALRDSRSDDPDNRLLAHQNRRRLDFEALRDSFLAAAGRLDPAVGGRPVDLFNVPFPARRTVYGLIDRSNFPGTFRSFDVASPDQHSPQRFLTTVPTQALFLLNSPFVAEQAKALANRPEVVAAKSADEKLTKLYRAALGRNTTRDELALGREFVGAGAQGGAAFGKWEQFAQVLLLSNEFAFVD
ncbi:MAG: Planctomycete cytochrome [Gemmataceae bacterium]|nr:Planctomycete cytochrome [Gemmataceae bacterium]